MRILATLLVLQSFFLAANSQTWEVPADRKGKLSPFRFTDDTRKAGETLYMLNCKSCHGNPGKGDFQATLKPTPADPATEKIQNNLDGELFYKVSTGRGPMPSFRNSLSSNEIWTVIAFLRGFRKDYVQEIAPIIRSAAYPGADILITLSAIETEKRIMMKVIARTEKSEVPVTNAGVKLFVKRYFGQMAMGDEAMTDKEGKAYFSIPDGFPADTAGKLHLSARFTDEDTFGAFSKDTILVAGTKINAVSLTRDRAMWNVVRKAPVWVILSYTLGVFGVWGFIVLVMLKLREIFIIGEHLGKKEETNS
ncbi:MAG: cytochrome c [Bacteroidales bacterium]